MSGVVAIIIAKANRLAVPAFYGPVDCAVNGKKPTIKVLAAMLIHILELFIKPVHVRVPTVGPYVCSQSARRPTK